MGDEPAELETGLHVHGEERGFVEDRSRGAGAAGRFLARTMCDPSRAGVAVNGDAVMEGAGELSLGGSCWRSTVEMVDLGVGTGGSTLDCVEAIVRASSGVTVAFTDGSRDETGKVAGGGVAPVGERAVY